ncbi:MAG: helix-turn-helix domain-containing protein [Candidatus Dojkabacteria bacterium]|nr:helix-turn-helix domain-containing protein [Candidatus Dojkabacteria bacterium]
MDNDIEIKKGLLKEIGQKIKQAREEMKMSQLQVGVAIGVTDKTISAYESARISPPIDKLVMLANLFKKPVHYFLGYDPKEYTLSTRLRAVEILVKEIRNLLNEIKLLSQNNKNTN